jgi:hypothetical protein
MKTSTLAALLETYGDLPETGTELHRSETERHDLAQDERWGKGLLAEYSSAVGRKHAKREVRRGARRALKAELRNLAA